MVAFANILALHQITMLLKTEEEENFEKEVVGKGQRMKDFLKILLYHCRYVLILYVPSNVKKKVLNPPSPQILGKSIQM